MILIILTVCQSFDDVSQEAPESEDKNANVLAILAGDSLNSN